MLTKEQFASAATLINCEVAVIKAVYDVEAAGQALLKDGRIKILFEGHRFWRQLVKSGKDPQAILSKHPELSNVLYRTWDRTNYKGGTGEWNRMSLAIQACQLAGVPSELALRSASYGAFQIMGENCLKCGYDSAHEMIFEYNKGGEGEQLDSFIRFVQSTHLDDELRTHKWAEFAEGFNGTAYKLNKYDTKLRNAYLKFKKV